jgi:hypothetical protein
MVLGSILGAGNTLFLPVGKFYWITGFINSTTAMAFVTSTLHSQTFPSCGGWLCNIVTSTWSLVRTWEQVPSFLVPRVFFGASASSQCEGANFCTLYHFHNSCHLRTCSRFVRFPHFFHFLHLGTNLFTWNPTTRSSGQKEKASRVTCDGNWTCIEPAVRYRFLDSGGQNGDVIEGTHHHGKPTGMMA